MTGSRARTVVGLAVLAVALAALVGLNRVATQRVSGTPEADWPEPPAVGSCVDLLSGVDAVPEVPCDGPHDAEVTKSYSALDPVLLASPSASIDAACADATRSYLGYGASGLYAPPGVEGGWASGGADGVSDAALTPLDLAYLTTAIGAPAAERVGDRGWQICVIQPEPAVRYAGSVRGATLADAPDAFRTCWGSRGGVEVASCAAPHAFEVFGAASSRISVTLVIPPAPGRSGGAALGGGLGGAPSGGAAEGQTGEAQRAAELAAQQQRIWDAVRATNGRAALAAAIAEDMERAVDAGEPAESAVSGEVDGQTLDLARQIFDSHRKLVAQCRTLVAERLAVADPTYGGVLTVAVRPEDPAGAATLSGGTISPPPADPTPIGGDSDADGAPSGYTLTMGFGPQFCVISAPQNRQLARSLVGWGDAPLPLTGG